MKIFRHIVALLSVVLTVLPSCSKVEPKDVVFEEKEKTLLLYFASHNNLYMDAASNISKSGTIQSRTADAAEDGELGHGNRQASGSL